MSCVSLPARTWLKNPTRPIGRWKHEQMFQTIVWSYFFPIFSALYHKIHPLNKKRTQNHCNFRHETWAHPLSKALEKQWMNICLYIKSKTQKLKCTSKDLSDRQIWVMCGWIGFGLSEKRAIMLHRTGLATSQLLEDKKHIFGLHFAWMPSQHQYLA